MKSIFFQNHYSLNCFSLNSGENRTIFFEMSQDKVAKMEKGNRSSSFEMPQDKVAKMEKGKRSSSFEMPEDKVAKREKITPEELEKLRLDAMSKKGNRKERLERVKTYEIALEKSIDEEEEVHATTRAEMEEIKKEVSKASPEEDKRNAARVEANTWRKEADQWLATHPETEENKEARDALIEARDAVMPENDPSYAAELDLAKATDPKEKADLLIVAKNKAKELRAKTLTLKQKLADADATEPKEKAKPKIEFKDPASEREKRNGARVEANTWRKEADRWLASHPETEKNKDARKALIEARDKVKPQNDPSYAAELDLAKATDPAEKAALLIVAKNKAEALKAKTLTLKQKLADAEK